MRVVPSPSIPSPQGHSYYSGGYITERYSSKNFAKCRLNGIQIELPAKMREANNFEGFARKIALSIFEFYHVNNFDKLVWKKK